jgi:hypothetical protein
MNKFRNEFCTTGNEFAGVSAEELNQIEGGGIIGVLRDIVGRCLANATGNEVRLGNTIYLPDVHI